MMFRIFGNGHRPATDRWGHLQPVRYAYKLRDLPAATPIVHINPLYRSWAFFNRLMIVVLVLALVSVLTLAHQDPTNPGHQHDGSAVLARRSLKWVVATRLWWVLTKIPVFRRIFNRFWSTEIVYDVNSIERQLIFRGWTNRRTDYLFHIYSIAFFIFIVVSINVDFRRMLFI